MAYNGKKRFTVRSCTPRTQGPLPKMNGPGIS